jgi:general secretion pathway protein I
LSRAAHRKRTGGSSAGFTMIEVLVALALVAIALAAIGSVVAATTRGVSAMEQRVALVEIARSVAASLPPASGRAVVPSAGEIQGHRWQLDVAPWTEDGPAAAAKSPWYPQIVTIRIKSPSGAILALRTVRLQKRAGG